MGLTEREKTQHELLDALFHARKRVELLETALAHNAAYLGIGVEREDRTDFSAPGTGRLPSAILRYLELVEPEDDISNYIGSEDNEESRPRLGKDAPEHIRPKKEPEVSPRVRQIALSHPADSFTFGFSEPVDGNSSTAEQAKPPSSGAVGNEDAAEQRKEEAEALRPLRLLVAEDGHSGPSSLCALLKKTGYSPLRVNGGRQALEALKVRAFDCLITDLWMPVMDGLELARRIREDDSDAIEPAPRTLSLLGLAPNARPALHGIPGEIPIIVLGAHATRADKERLLDLGINYCLVKPATAAEITAILTHIGLVARAREEI